MKLCSIYLYISLIRKPLNFIHIIACQGVSPFNNAHSLHCYIVLLARLFISRHLGCSQCLDIANNAVI